MDGKPPPILPVARCLHPSLASALPIWLRVALLSFGGPAGQYRGDAPRPCRGETLDFGVAVPPCLELLHAVARSRAQELVIYSDGLCTGARRHCRRGLLILPGFVALMG